MGRPTKLLALSALLLCWIGPVLAEEANPVFEQPEDPQATLHELDDVVVQKQKALFAARMRANPDEIKKAQEEFEAVQKQRGKAVRALEQGRGALPAFTLDSAARPSKRVPWSLRWC